MLSKVSTSCVVSSGYKELTLAIALSLISLYSGVLIKSLNKASNTSGCSFSNLVVITCVYSSINTSSRLLGFILELR